MCVYICMYMYIYIYIHTRTYGVAPGVAEEGAPGPRGEDGRPPGGHQVQPGRHLDIHCYYE